jgi:hypothetical protein
MITDPVTGYALEPIERLTTGIGQTGNLAIQPASTKLTTQVVNRQQCADEGSGNVWKRGKVLQPETEVIGGSRRALRIAIPERRLRMQTVYYL